MTKFSFTFVILIFSFLVLLSASCKNKSEVKLSTAKDKVVIITPMSHPSLKLAIDGFIQGLKEKGFDESNISLEIVNANGDFKQISSLTKQAIIKKPSLIFVLTTPAAMTAIKITDSANVPLVYTAVTDPVGARIVTGMEKSETLATGVSDRYPVKEQVKFFHMIYPSMKNVGIIFNPSESNSKILVTLTIKALKKMGVAVHKYEIYKTSEISIQTQNALVNNDCIIVNGDNLATENLSIIINLCIKHKKPLFVGDPDSVRKGGVATVGPSYFSLGKRSGYKAAQILKGISPKRIPSEYPTAFTYIINTIAAQQMGVEISPAVWNYRRLWISTEASK